MTMTVRIHDDDDDDGDDADDEDGDDDDDDDDDEGDDVDDDCGGDDDDDKRWWWWSWSAQNLGPHFVRACAVEIHVHMSQDTSEEQLYTEIYRKKCRGPRLGPERGHTLCASLCSRNARQDFTRFIRKFTGKTPQTKMSPERGRTFCASLRSRNARQDFARAALYNAAGQSEHPDQAPASTLIVRTAECAHTVWGIFEELNDKIYGILE